MRISTKGRHAVMAMVDLARQGNEKPIPLAEVAMRQKISLSYLEQLVAKLKKHGLVKSMRGPGGGYLLGQPAEAITVHQIVVAVDTAAQREHPVFEGDNLTARQMTDQLWLKMGGEIEKFLKSVSLADVLHRKA